MARGNLSLSEWGPLHPQGQWVQELLASRNLSLEGLSRSGWEGPM